MVLPLLEAITIPQGGDVRTNGTLTYILGDHLGSTSIVTDSSGALISEMKYKAWGEVRYTSGTSPTNYTYTGQYSHTADFGLMFYNARWYDPTLGRFAQADSIVPGGVQGFDRYAYVNNSPLVYIDPSGYESVCGSENSDPECNSADNWSLPFVDSQYGIDFIEEWTDRNENIVREGVSDLAAALLAAHNNSCGWSENCAVYTAAQMFSEVYNTSSDKPLNFQWVNSACEINRSTCYADAYQYPTTGTIRVYAEYFLADGGRATTPVTAQLIVHELGHAFTFRAGGNPVDYIGEYGGGVLTKTRQGFATGYTFGQGNSASEISADMFVGWVYGQWDYSHELASTRNTVMTTNIINWMTVAQNNR